MRRYFASENSTSSPLFDSARLFFLEGSTKIFCHRCLQPFETKFLVQCQIPGCGTYYCRPCLVRRYKYSKKAVKKLPSSIWKCPKCRRKCICNGYYITQLIGALPLMKNKLCSRESNTIEELVLKKKLKD